MSSTFLFTCVIVALVQIVKGQCIGNAYNSNLAENLAITGTGNNGYATGLVGMPAGGIPNGGGFMVKSSSAIAPNGVTVQSENLHVEGPLAVSGMLPFLGVVALEGPLSAAGSGAVDFGCGDGNVGIINEGLLPNAMELA